MMDLERVIAALARRTSSGALRSRSRDSPTTPRVAPGALFFCVPGARADGHDFAPRRSRAAPSRSSSSGRSTLDVPQLVVADVARAMARRGGRFFGDPTRELEVAGVTGTNGKTTTTFLLYAILDAAGRRPGCSARSSARRRRAAPRVADDARGDRPAALFREMLDAGDRSCAMEATSHALRARGGSTASASPRSSSRT
jgi:UDP-N-acetylmuramoyl-L-alanyl-D-glutamate--2,6-diaminopimelate ligase